MTLQELESKAAELQNAVSPSGKTWLEQKRTVKPFSFNDNTVQGFWLSPVRADKLKLIDGLRFGNFGELADVMIPNLILPESPNYSEALASDDVLFALNGLLLQEIKVASDDFKKK